MEKLRKTPSIPQKQILTSRRNSDASPPFLVGSHFGLQNLQSFASTPEQEVSLSRLSLQQQSSSKQSSSSTDEKVFPNSELMASTAITSSESDQPDLDYLQRKKEKLALIWLDLNLALSTVGFAFQIQFFQDSTEIGRAFIAAHLGCILFQFVLVSTCHVKRHLLWIPLVALELQYIIFDWNQSFTASSLLKPDASEKAQQFIHFMVDSVDYFSIIGFFQNTLMVLYFLENMKAKRNFLYFIAVLIFGFQAISLRRWHFPESYESSKDFFIVFSLLNALVLNLLFVSSVVNLQTIQRTLYKLELEENRKFKCMFNAIQDGVILLEDTTPKFINSLALKIFDEAMEDSSGDHSLSVYDQPIFYPFHPSSESSSLGEPGVASSICDLMSYEPKVVGETTFTTSQSISECSRMDQVHKIVASKEASAEKAHFYSIRFLRVNRSHSTKKDKADHIMVQIQDISARVQGQFMKLERQYLSLMNSTVSHEMRNPLNALVCQITAQEKRFDELRALSKSLETCEFKNSILELLEGSKRSLAIAKSSTKLLKFNVEDILALPQLKQGRFTKQFSLVNLKSMVSEVVQIMEFQAQQKEVEVAVEFRGFWESPDGGIHINLDEQRFQQVLLNYLSNGLKFTERSGKILILLQYVAPVNIRDDQGQFGVWEDRTAEFWAGRASSRNMQFCSDSFSESSSEGSKMSLEQAAKYIHLQKEATKDIFEQGLSPKLVITVADTGIGIKVEEQTRLFKLFGTIKRTRSVNTRGVGLGLSISKMICEEFGGTVSLKSQEKVGSAFVASFVLDQACLESSSEQSRCTQTSLQKRVQAARSGQQVAAKLTSSQVATLQEKQSKIIIVDDEAYNCEVLKAMVSSLGIPNIQDRLQVFMCGTEALQAVHHIIAEGEELKVLLTDLSMPIMDGYSLISRVRKLFESRKAPMIAALTGHTETEFISKAYKKGADHVYSKPISMEQIQLVLLEAGIFMEKQL